jgi:hypothetical protein
VGIHVPLPVWLLPSERAVLLTETLAKRFRRQFREKTQVTVVDGPHQDVRVHRTEKLNGGKVARLTEQGADQMVVSVLMKLVVGGGLEKATEPRVIQTLHQPSNRVLVRLMEDEPLMVDTGVRVAVFLAGVFLAVCLGLGTK